MGASGPIQEKHPPVMFLLCSGLVSLKASRDDLRNDPQLRQEWWIVYLTIPAHDTPSDALSHEIHRMSSQALVLFSSFVFIHGLAS